MAPAYWDPRAEVARLDDGVRWVWPGKSHDAGKAPSYMRGKWDERNWLNVPGPFYGAETDTCGAGPPAAPANVLCDDWGKEFIWRQPRNPEELLAVLDAAYQDPFDGYGWDGHDHWTPDLVLEWWEQRERVIEWIANEESAELAPFRAYVNGGLGEDLGRYADWLSRR